MDGPEIDERAFRFACRSVELYRALRKAGGAGCAIAPQLLKAATIGANLEEATGGQSKPDFISKTCIALKEAREARYWLRLIDVTRLLPDGAVRDDLQEVKEIVAILVTIIRRSRGSPGRG